MPAGRAAKAAVPLIRWREHVVSAALKYRSFGAAAQKLKQHRIFRLPHVIGRSLFNDFSVIQHRHTRRDMERALHKVRNDDRRCLRSFSEIDDQFVD